MPATVNPSVAFEPVAIDVTVAGHAVTLPPYPAAVWIPLLTAVPTDALDIFPGLLDPRDQDRVDELLLTGQLDPEELLQTVYEIIAEVSGHEWWWTLHLLSTLRGRSGTEIIGEMARVDAGTISLGGWVNALYALLVKDRKQEDRMRLDAELEMPPPGVDLEISEADQAATEATFFSMMQSNG